MDSLICCGVYRTHDRREAQMVCSTCGDVQRHHDPEAGATQHLALGVTTRRPARYAYKRLTHFRMWLDRLEGRDIVPEKTLDAVRPILQAFGRATPERVRTILREVGDVGHLNSTASILLDVFGYTPFRLEASVRADLESMFMDIEAAFLEVRGLRKNMLSYSFVLTRMLELLDVDARFEEIKQMKHPGKIVDADALWQRICGRLGFPYHDSFK